MRENIGLYRGKRTGDGEWVEGYLTYRHRYDQQSRKEILGPVIDCPQNFTFGNTTGKVIGSYKVDPGTEGQFTGLTDKNGKKIFEGDIVVCRKEIGGNWIDYCVEIGFVEMKHGAFGLHRKQGYYRPFKDWLEDYEYEVVGNIHDNKELLHDNPELLQEVKTCSTN